MPDPFAAYAAGLDGPASDGAAVTPNDSADLANSCRALFVGTAGNVKVDMVSGTTLTFVGVTAGSVLPIRARRVYSTGTTASNMVAIF